MRSVIYGQPLKEENHNFQLNLAFRLQQLVKSEFILHIKTFLSRIAWMGEEIKV